MFVTIGMFNLISATLLMVTIFKLSALLSIFIILIEMFFIFCWLYRIFSDWFQHGVVVTKDKNKRDVFFHALGEAACISFFISSNVSCAGFFWWGAHDESGLAWLLMFLVLIIPFVFFSIFCYKGCYGLFKMEQAQKERDSESIER